MSQEKRTVVLTTSAPPPLPVYSQAIVSAGMVFCSGQLGVDPQTKKMVETGIGDRTTQCLLNLSAVLEAANSSIDNVVRVGIFLTTMDNFAAMNAAYEKFFHGKIKPARTCVAVHQLPLGGDVEIECVAHL